MNRSYKISLLVVENCSSKTVQEDGYYPKSRPKAAKRTNQRMGAVLVVSGGGGAQGNSFVQGYIPFSWGPLSLSAHCIAISLLPEDSGGHLLPLPGKEDSY
ncbi:Hypothetical protein NTJ_10396 [Nesidiocoris tenuis]|uniref:Uncharacterized protein n=1 Tax=Nesidiocoris tenuis TaxID=355587 RepID=A0ABN7B4A4_9HEMI|nr:Hypothetical protein NTJ_10396 [Nesidiocoris tenuis]